MMVFGDEFRSWIGRLDEQTILYESCLGAKKLGYNEVSVLELGIAGGNGIISLENYKKKIECNFKLYLLNKKSCGVVPVLY